MAPHPFLQNVQVLEETLRKSISHVMSATNKKYGLRNNLRRRTTKASQGSMESTRSITAYERFMNMVKLWIEKSYKGVDQVSRYLRWKRPKTKSLCFARASGLTQAARIYKNVLKRGTKALQNRTHPGTQKWSQNDANMDPKTSQNGAGPMGYPPPSGRLRRTPDEPHFFEVF